MVDPVSYEVFPESELWDKLAKRKRLIFFDIEITARCNNDCTHCYINLPAGDHEAKNKELSLKQICDIADQAVEMGALWCLITGGEPLLREDFFDIYMVLRKKGLLTSVFTNACLVTEEHADLFQKYPPRDIEVTVYGVTKSTYEKISRRPGSFEAFMCGLDILLSRGI
ncbi:MAG: radical SAM protein, partial [Candidatus Aegiribacteria sp.]|nr:radical SAM protein [Candidatus Aegiribacteria sp.]